ncbi:MAG: Spy/CpxP family protein refolding chaperone [Thermodesulfovibrionales bacterium]
MKKLLMVFVAVIMVAGMSVASDAMMKKGRGGHERGMGKGPGAGMCGEQMMMEKFKELGLDDKQKETVKAIKLRMKKDTIKRNSDIEVAKIELQEIVGKDVVDLAAAEAKVKQLHALKAEMKIAHIKAREEVKATLTPEQRKKFSEMHGMGCTECGMGGGKGMMKHGRGMKGGCDKCGMMKDMDGDERPGPGPHAGHKQMQKK